MKDRVTASAPSVLQWSRTLTSAEIGMDSFLSLAKICFNGAALLRVRKYSALGSSWGLFYMLQWSRTLTSAEIGKVRSMTSERFWLQWSRTLTSAEIALTSALSDTPSYGLQWSRTLTSAEIGDKLKGRPALSA